MRPGVWIKKFAWFLACFAAMLILAGVDWLPSLKDLSRHRRERHDEMLKIKNLSIQVSGFIFPDAAERSLFSQSDARLRAALAKADDDSAWLEMTSAALRRQANADRVIRALLAVNSGPGQVMDPPLNLTGATPAADLSAWLGRQDSQGRLQSAADPGRFPWRAIFVGSDFSHRLRPAIRPLAIVLTAPVPALLNFINHCSWSDSRLEIVHLRLELGDPLPRVQLICRGTYLVRKPSVWVVPGEFGSSAGNLLIDPDSPLLWQKVNPDITSQVPKKELPSGAGAAAL